MLRHLSKFFQILGNTWKGGSWKTRCSLTWNWQDSWHPAPSWAGQESSPRRASAVRLHRLLRKGKLAHDLLTYTKWTRLCLCPSMPFSHSHPCHTGDNCASIYLPSSTTECSNLELNLTFSMGLTKKKKQRKCNSPIEFRTLAYSMEIEILVFEPSKFPRATGSPALLSASASWWGVSTVKQLP